MRVLLTGATGFIGGHVLRRLSDRGHEVVCPVRGDGQSQIDSMGLPGVQTFRGRFTRPEEWSDRLRGVDVVINAVGIIRETRSATFATVHTDAPIALFRAAESAGVSRIVQISALGADERAVSKYHLSKRAADDHLRQSTVAHAILRPSFVYGPGDHSMTFFRSMAAGPVTLVPGDGRFLVQPVHVDDLVRVVQLAVDDPEPTSCTVEVAGAEALSFNELLDVLARSLGKRRALKLHVPMPFMSLVARVTDLLGRGPITQDELLMLRQGNSADAQPLADRFGFRPLSFPVGIARQRLTEADKWHARLKPLRLLLRLSVAFVWIATGIVSAFFSVETGMRLLADIGITGTWASVALYGTSWFEIAIGTATAVGWRVRWMGTIQLLLILGFTAILTIGAPSFWLHPFGPLTKNVPIVAATLVMMAIED